jgi:predicted Zn-dependent protease
VLAGCAVNPATGERQLSFIGEGQEVEMGRNADEQIVASMGLYPDSSLQRYVDRIGQEMAAASERPDLPWTFRVLDDPTVNAFALPGGFVYLTRGIMSHLQTEAQLAGILGHEIGHVTARHSVNQMSRQQLAQLGLGVGMILSEEVRRFGDLAGAGLQLLTLKFSRDDENESDELGIRYMTRAGYEPAELADVMQMLERHGQLRSGGSGRIPEWQSTHPDPANRVENIRRIIQEAGDTLATAEAVQRDDYLGRIDGMIFGPDPREGFFDNSVFHHPELRFRFEVPSGWRTANTKQAVQALSPEQDAALILTLSDGQPRAALSEFGSQDGLTMGRLLRESVNGLPAAMARFSAATEDGELQGLVLFVEHRGTTYRMLGYAPASRWSAREAPLERSLLSFRPETDPGILRAQPDRLDMVRLGSSLGFRSFVERYPSTVEPAVVAVINQVEEGTVLDAGRSWKRVVEGG